jgi:3-hydroxyacyl-[acyl-carrier-protein] dehydratase
MMDAAAPQEGIDIAIERVMEMIPHRYPMLLIDKVINVVAGESATGVKNVTFNEHFFQGHFPSKPVMPGVLIIESLAQTAAVLVVHTLGPDAEGKLVYFMSVDNAKFRKPVGPGDVVHARVVKDRRRNAVWRIKGEARVDGVLVAEATITAMIQDR